MQGREATNEHCAVVLLVAQGNRLSAIVSASCARADRLRSCVVGRSKQRLRDRRTEFLQRMLTAGPPRETKRPQSLRSGRGNSIDPVTVSCDQRVLGREVGVDPICGLVGDLELTETGEQPLRATPPMVLIKAGWMRLSLPRGAAASQPSDETLIKAWASMMSFRPKHGLGHPPPNLRLPSRASRSPSLRRHGSCAPNSRIDYPVALDRRCPQPSRIA